MQWLCEGLRARGFRPRPARRLGAFAWVDAESAEQFLGQLLEAVESGADVVLWCAQWPASVRDEAETHLQEFAATRDSIGLVNAEPLILIPTGGSSGRTRFAIHTEATLRAAARGFVERWGGASAAAWNVLPLYHVGGLMSLLRAIEGDAPWQTGHYLDLLERPLPEACTGSLSLVPTQLGRLLDALAAVDHLRSVQRIFVGGAGMSPDLRARARAAALPIAPCYGMTETAAMVAAMEPAAFLSGNEGCGTWLPHARGRFEEGAGTATEPGRIVIESSSVALGRTPDERFSEQVLATADSGFLDAQNSLHIVRRIDGQIVTGGETVDPARIEATLRAAAPGCAVHVLGVPDADWGEIVVAFVAGATIPGDLESGEWRERLRPFERPKKIVRLASLPRNALGKIDGRALRERLR